MYFHIRLIKWLIQIADRKKIETDELQIKIKTCKLQADVTTLLTMLNPKLSQKQTEDKTYGCLLKENI